MGCFDSGGSKSTSTSYTPEQKNWLTQALAQYGPQLGKGQTSYPGQQVAEFTPTQKAALGGTEGFLEKFSPDAPMPMYGETGGALSGILSGKTGAQPITPQQTQSFFKSAIQDPARQQFEQYTRPLIREEYAGPGFWGSARAGAVGRAGQEMGQWLGQKRGELEWQVGESNRAVEEAKAGRALSAVPMGMDYAGQPAREAATRLAGRQGVFGFAGAEYQQQQLKINEAMQKFQEGKRLTDEENLSILMQLLGMGYSTSSSSTRGAGMFGGQGGFGNLMKAGFGVTSALGF